MSGQRYGITSVSIRDFRGIESLDLDFRDPSGQPNRVVVLAGPNGCGKTAVLEACLIALGRKELVEGAVGKESVRRGASGCSIESNCLDETGSIALSSDEKDSVTDQRLQKTPFASFDRRKYFRWPSLSITYFPSRREPSVVGPVHIQTGAAISQQNSTAQRSDPIREIKKRIVNARTHELLVPKRRSEILETGGLFARVAATWRQFFAADESFDVAPVGDDPRLGFDVYLRRHGESISVDGLSSGEQQVFLLACQLALDEPSTGIIFIDEPELHLDPQWHAVILRVLMDAQPDCQFIVGTHSPEIYDSVMSYERHFLVPADDPRAKLWHVKESREGAA